MKTLATAIALAAFAATPAAAQSCYDLWYARNLIYAQNGYCFNTDLGRRAFAEYPCWTSNPALIPTAVMTDRCGPNRAYRLTG